MANSRVLAGERANRRFATLVQAISRTIPTAPSSNRSVPPASPTIDRMSGSVVADDLLSNVQRQVGLVEGHRDRVGETHPLNSHHARSLLIPRWRATISLAATTPLLTTRAEALRPWISMSSTNPVSFVSSCETFGASTNVPRPSDFQYASLDEILNCSSNRYAADAKSRQQFIFTR
jgi:hypothetical protein